MLIGSMTAKLRKRAKIRSFERDLRVKRLIEAGIISNRDEIPADAIPAGVEFVRANRTSLSRYNRKPYYRDLPFTCTDCGAKAVWTADEQRYWYEVLRGSPYSTAARCSSCRKKRKGIPQRKAQQS